MAQLNKTQLLFLLLMFSANFSFAQKNKKDTDVIYWKPNQLLTFNNFKGSPSQSDTALSDVSAKMKTHNLGAIVKSIDVNLLTQRNGTTFTIYAGMKQSLSWLKDCADSTELKHEQGHFDICEIYAREFRKEIERSQNLTQAKGLYEKMVAEEEAEQDLYDKYNTYNLGGITDEWATKITNRLKELDNYKNPIVALPYNK